MGRKKGRQAGYFTSKSKRAAFVTEWQSQVVDVRHDHQQQQQQRKEGYVNKLTTTPSSSSFSFESGSNTVRRLQQQHDQEEQQRRPKFRWTHLHHVLNERQRQQQRQEDPYLDGSNSNNREETNEYASTMPSSSSLPSSSSSLSPRLNIYDDDNDSYRECGLVLLCIQTLAPVLRQYIDDMGRDTVRHYLSLLPGKTLTALCVELSVRNLWNIDLIYVVTQHDHLRRLALWWNNDKDNDNDNSNPKDDNDKRRMRTAVNLEQALILQPTSLLRQEQQQQRVVPDSWEDEVATSDNGQSLFGQSTVAATQHRRSRRRLQRLDMRIVTPHLFPSLDTIVSLINSRHTTHLTLHLHYQDTTTTSTTLGRQQRQQQQQQYVQHRQHDALVNYLVANEFHFVHLDLSGYYGGGGTATSTLPIRTTKRNNNGSRRRCREKNANNNNSNNDDDDSSNDEWNL